jgi:hypothetical protein
MKHTVSTFAASYSPFGNVRSTAVCAGAWPITGPRFLRGHPEARALPSAGVTRLRRYYDPLRVPAEPLSLLRALEFTSARTGVPPLAQTTFPACRAHCPGGPEPVRISVASRPVQPSPLFRRVGVHNFTFEACSGFTRVTACKVAQPPEVAFVTRLRPGPLPVQAACQLPDLPTTIWVGLSPTGDLRRWGALNKAGYGAPGSDGLAKMIGMIGRPRRMLNHLAEGVTFVTLIKGTGLSTILMRTSGCHIYPSGKFGRQSGSLRFKL